MNLLAFLAAVLADLFIAPFEIGAAAIDDVPVIEDVSNVDRLDNDADVTRALVKTAAARVRIGTEIAEVDEGVAIGADIAGAIDPRAHADVELTRGFRREGSPANARTCVTLALAPRDPG